LQEYFSGFVGGDGTGDVEEGWGYNKCRALFIVGPSGSGKCWLAKKIVSMHEDKFGLVVSHTTRPPRAGETDKVDYIFTDREAVNIGKEGGEYLATFENEGEVYGTMRDRVYTIVAIGRVPIITCTIEGALELRKQLAGDLMPRCILLKPSADALAKRLPKLGLSDEIVAARQMAFNDFETTLKQRPGLFDSQFDAQYSDTNVVEFVQPFVDSIAAWALNQNWEAKIDDDMALAALKIQGQARRKRDTRKVHAIKDNRQKVCQTLSTS